MWIDQGAEPGWAGLNDPRQLVFNVTTTGDPAALEADIRAVWGGALCVTEAEHSGPELREVAEAISGPNVLNANANEQLQVVTVDTYVPDDGAPSGAGRALRRGPDRAAPLARTGRLTPTTESPVDGCAAGSGRSVHTAYPGLSRCR